MGPARKHIKRLFEFISRGVGIVKRLFELSSSAGCLADRWYRLAKSLIYRRYLGVVADVAGTWEAHGKDRGGFDASCGRFFGAIAGNGARGA